jgi:outer membrane protein assembly factor BamE
MLDMPARPPMPQTRPLRPTLTLLATMTVLVLASGCTSTDRSRSGLFQPFRIDVPQGNYVDQGMLQQVKPGMTRDQVRFALGTPLLVDPFRPDRWDYVFRFQHPNGTADLRRTTIFFAEGKVDRIQADAMPATDEGNDPALPGYRRKQGRNR